MNFLNLGPSAANTLDAAPGLRDVSEAQQHALCYLREQVGHFLEGMPERMPEINWATAAKSTRADYKGEMLLKGVPVTWAQVEPRLPPEGLAGSIAAASLASDEMRPWILVQTFLRALQAGRTAGPHPRPLQAQGDKFSQR